jgi:hypothetical protein
VRGVARRGTRPTVLVQVATTELVLIDEVEDERVRCGSGGFHEVGGEGAAVALVGVHDSEAGVEADGVRGDGGLDFEDCVGVVEEGVDGVVALRARLRST